VPIGHKIALKDLKAGDTAIKYGEDIGKIVADIPKGGHVHTHNVQDETLVRSLEKQRLDKSKYSNITFKGFRRENGRVGVRNHVLILPVDDISNAACEAVANNVKGTLAIPHAYGRLQFGEDLELHFRTMIGTGPTPTWPPSW
jgi:altronate dehydratase